MKKKKVNGRLLLNKERISKLENRSKIRGGANNNNSVGCQEYSDARNCNASLDGINCGLYSRYYCLTYICD